MVDSILFLIEDTIIVGEDKILKDENGKVKYIKDRTGKTVTVPANTIVVNTNCIRRDYSSYNIYHECYHNEEHYLFFRLQEMASNDMRSVETKTIVVKKDEVVKNEVYFMEKQANRGAYGLMLPATNTNKMIDEECRKVQGYRNVREQFEMAGEKISDALLLPYFRIRARMIQLGNIEAKGCFNYVDKEKIEPFACRKDAWQEEDIVFVIDERTACLLRRSNDDLDELMSSGKYVYADGHIIRNDSRYVFPKNGKLCLTDKALSCLDDCCLPFVRVYIQKNVGTYTFGRMYYDADYIKQTEFYLSDIIKQEKVDELDAKEIYVNRFPVEFKECIKLLKKKNKGSDEKLAEYFDMDDSTLSRWLEDPRKYRNEDFLTLLCLYFKLPDWLSRMVFKRAKFQLDEDDKRHSALLHILRVQSNDGKEAANNFLKRHDLDTLRI